MEADDTVEAAIPPSPLGALPRGPRPARQPSQEGPAEPSRIGDTEDLGRHQFGRTDNLEQHAPIGRGTVVAIAALPARLSKELGDAHGTQAGLAEPVLVRAALRGAAASKIFVEQQETPRVE